VLIERFSLGVQKRIFPYLTCQEALSKQQKPISASEAHIDEPLCFFGLCEIKALWIRIKLDLYIFSSLRSGSLYYIRIRIQQLSYYILKILSIFTIYRCFYLFLPSLLQSFFINKRNKLKTETIFFRMAWKFLDPDPEFKSNLQKERKKDNGYQSYRIIASGMTR